MTIGFDAKRAFLNNTGLGNYSRTVIQSMCEHFPEHHYYAFTPRTGPGVYAEQLLRYEHIELITAPPLMPKSLWRSWGIVNTIQEKDLEVYHGLSNELPFNAGRMSCKKVVTIHDLIFESHPGLYKPIDRKIYHYKFKNACIHADSVIAISAYTKNEIVNRYGIPEAKIQVVYQDAAPIFKQEYAQHQLDYIREKYRLPDTFILQVGTLEKRKNAAVTINALPHLRHKVPLVLVGRATEYRQELDALMDRQGLGREVLFLEDVSYYALPLIYRQATVFVYPSRIEGFGIPVLEGLYSGVPVIAATGSCLEEAGGSETLYFDPDDPVALAGHIDRVTGGDFRVNKTRLLQHLSQFEPLHLSQQLMTIYQAT